MANDTTNEHIYRFYFRGLKSIKITHFISIDMESFEVFMVGKMQAAK